MSDITNINDGTAKLASEDLLPVVFLRLGFSLVGRAGVEQAICGRNSKHRHWAGGWSTNHNTPGHRRLGANRLTTLGEIFSDTDWYLRHGLPLCGADQCVAI